MTLPTLEQRVEQLERGTRRWKTSTTIILAILTVVSLGVSISARAPVLVVQAPTKVAEEVRSQKFVLGDNDGKVRASLGWSPERGTTLLLGGAGSERPRVSISADDESASISLSLGSDRKGAQISLWTDVTTGTSFSLDYDNLGIRERLRHAEQVRKRPDVPVTEVAAALQKGVQGARISIHPRVGTSFSISDREDRIRLKLKLDENGAPSVSLMDDAQNTRAVLGHTELETVRTGSVQQRAASSLVLFDKEGKVIWKVP